MHKFPFNARVSLLPLTLFSFQRAISNKFSILTLQIHRRSFWDFFFNNSNRAVRTHNSCMHNPRNQFWFRLSFTRFTFVYIFLLLKFKENPTKFPHSRHCGAEHNTLFPTCHSTDDWKMTEKIPNEIACLISRGITCIFLSYNSHVSISKGWHARESVEGSLSFTCCACLVPDFSSFPVSTDESWRQTLRRVVNERYEDITWRHSSEIHFI